MNEFKQGYENGWHDCVHNRREHERTVLEAACMERHLSPNGSARELLARVLCWELDRYSPLPDRGNV